MKIKLSDWVANKIHEMGIEHAFMITGGGSMHLNHSISTHPKIETLYNHHEQACSIAAEAYYRVNNKLALLNVTSGPGGTNTITGVYGAYVDSIGMLIISGQVKYETTVRSTGLKLRQFGDQELDIEELIKPVTKYSQMVTDPNSIRYHLEKAFYLATSGRPGPCWLDIPLDVQASEIETDDLKGFDPMELNKNTKKINLEGVSKEILDLLSKAKRPVILAGSGIRLSGQHKKFIEIIDKLKIPVVTAWNAHDAIWNEHPCYMGRPGTVGDRPGNFVVQNSDLLIILGSRLNIRQVSYNFKSFAREAFKVWVEIDDIELDKSTVKPDLKINSDLKDFLPKFYEEISQYNANNIEHKKWKDWCNVRKNKYPIVLEEYWDNDKINPYCFMEKLFENLKENQIIISANGTACVTSFQAAFLKKGQRLWTNSGCATMGYDLPGAIGACKASGNKKTICLAGDGSIMMNLQELQTIVGNNLPIKIFILNNSGYVSMFQTQKNFFNGTEFGAGPKSGVNFPDFEKISKAFDMQYERCQNHDELENKIAKALATDDPAICEIMIDEKQVFAPKLGAKIHSDGTITSPPLEDLSPFLSKEELEENMLIKPFDAE
jgi:acetolactate synthase I/II/III large subunit